MENTNLYQNIKSRTDGDIYIGVVGPVRTGKSTFIKQFMDLLVIPNIEDEYKKERANDELPQSSAGRTIMTTEPKFIPNEAVQIVLGDNLKFKTRLVDCVGYLVNNAIGYMEDDIPRMVKTPWSEDDIPFEKAAEIGTQKVINEHSTIGIVITCDGSFSDIPREDYIDAEERVINELKSLNKPFVVVLNTADPFSEYSIQIARELENKHGVSVLPINCLNLEINDINNIFEKILYEFPVDQINFNLPKWVDSLDDDYWLKESLFEDIKKAFSNISVLKEVNNCMENISSTNIIKSSNIDEINLGNGNIRISIELNDNLFYQILSELTGVEVHDDGDLFFSLTSFARTKKEYDKISYALESAKTNGYGIVTPGMEDLILDEPEMIKQGSKFGIRLKATAPSLHIIRANIETEVAPVVGSEKQSEELIHYLMSEFESDPIKIWESNIFGKNLHELVNEGLQNKLSRMPEDAQMKLQETLERIVNEGSGGLICIIL